MEALTDDELRFLEDVLDLARTGATDHLVEAVDGGVPVNLTSPSGDSLLMLAAYHTHEATVAALLERGADHARVNDRGQTALGAATYRRSGTIVDLLLGAGADPGLGTPSALELAAFFGLPEMTARLAPR